MTFSWLLSNAAEIFRVLPPFLLTQHRSRCTLNGTLRTKSQGQTVTDGIHASEAAKHAWNVSVLTQTRIEVCPLAFKLTTYSSLTQTFAQCSDIREWSSVPSLDLCMEKIDAN